MLRAEVEWDDDDDVFCVAIYGTGDGVIYMSPDEARAWAQEILAAAADARRSQAEIEE
jgi:hypothetical protein